MSELHDAVVDVVFVVQNVGVSVEHLSDAVPACRVREKAKGAGAAVPSMQCTANETQRGSQLAPCKNRAGVRHLAARDGEIFDVFLVGTRDALLLTIALKSTVHCDRLSVTYSARLLSNRNSYEMLPLPLPV